MIAFTVEPLIISTGYQRPEREQAIRLRVNGALMRRYPGRMPGDPSQLRAEVGTGSLHVSITRCAPSPIGPSALPDALRGVRAEVGAWLGDLDRIRWTLGQERSDHAVRIEIEQVAT